MRDKILIFVAIFEQGTYSFIAMGIKKKVYILLLLCIVWTILIFILCTLPSSLIPKLQIHHIDKIAHFGFFFVQSVLLSLLLRLRTKRSYLQIICLSTFQAFIYGGVIEILQDEFFNRTGDWYDLLADVSGGFCGAMIYPAFFKFYNVCSKKDT